MLIYVLSTIKCCMTTRVMLVCNNTFCVDSYRDLPRMLSLTQSGQSAGEEILAHYLFVWYIPS